MRITVMKGATATLSYAFTEGDPLTLTVHRIGMKRYSRQSGVSGAFIALSSTPRTAVGDIPAGFDVSVDTTAIDAGEYQIDGLLNVGSAKEEIAPSWLTITLGASS